MRGADLLLLVMDGSRPTSPDVEELLRETEQTRRVVAVNKSDLSAHPELEVPEGAVIISALTGQGIETLKGAIHDTYTGGGQALTEMDGVVTSLRQAQALRKVRDGCSRVLQGLTKSRGAELLAVDLEEALMGVGELTGEVTVDEVLEEVFSRFCIGK
jgi:tRNA modification GTPase